MLNVSDDEDQCLPVTERSLNAASMVRLPLQALSAYCQKHASVIMYDLHAGKMFRVSDTPPKSREGRVRSPRTSQLHLYFSNAVEDMDHKDVLSEGGQAGGSPRAGRQGRTAKRKRRGSRSPPPTVRTKRRTVGKRQAAVASGRNPVNEDEDEGERREEDRANTSDGAETETEQMKIRDVKLYYYYFAFCSTNQLVCKDISKAWIRLCHPKKQSTHPYNGGKSSSKRSEAEFYYKGHFSAPDYWPFDEGWQNGRGCRHLEPDHLKKPERVVLLLHLLGCEDKGFVHGDFSLDKLQKATLNIHLLTDKEYWTTAHYERLQEIYRVRAMEMQFERGEIDGDTLVSIKKIKKPKPRGKARKGRKSAVKATKPPCERVKDESEGTPSTTSDAPIEGEDSDQSEGSEPNVLADRSSSVAELVPEANYTEPIPCEARTIQRGPPSFNSPSPADRRDQTVQENWTPQSAIPGHNSGLFTNPNPFGPVATFGEAQRSLPLRDQYHSGSSWVQGLPGQGFTYSQYDANDLRPNATSTQNPLRQLVAAQVDDIRHPTFAGSSSGLEGYYTPDVDYVSWPSEGYAPATNSSSGRGYGDATFGSGLPFGTYHNENQNGMPPFYPGL